MRCPECNEEMKEITPAQIQVQPVQKEEGTFPEKLICMLYNIYSCEKCGVKASKPSYKDYKVCTCKPIIDSENQELKPE